MIELTWDGGTAATSATHQNFRDRQLGVQLTAVRLQSQKWPQNPGPQNCKRTLQHQGQFTLLVSAGAVVVPDS